MEPRARPQVATKDVRPKWPRTTRRWRRRVSRAAWPFSVSKDAGWIFFSQFYVWCFESGLETGVSGQRGTMERVLESLRRPFARVLLEGIVYRTPFYRPLETYRSTLRQKRKCKSTGCRRLHGRVGAKLQRVLHGRRRRARKRAQERRRRRESSPRHWSRQSDTLLKSLKSRTEQSKKFAVSWSLSLSLSLSVLIVFQRRKKNQISRSGWCRKGPAFARRRHAHERVTGGFREGTPFARRRSTTASRFEFRTELLEVGRSIERESTRTRVYSQRSRGIFQKHTSIFTRYIGATEHSRDSRHARFQGKRREYALAGRRSCA